MTDVGHNHSDNRGKTTRLFEINYYIAPSDLITTSTKCYISLRATYLAPKFSHYLSSDPKVRVNVLK